jgi:hypothetical protein
MDYNHITNFLDRFKKILSQGEKGHTVIAEVMSKHISHVIETNTITIKGNCIYIQGSPMLHNEILMRKQAILSELLAVLPERDFVDIR